MTGIEALDSQLGGIPAGSVILCEGAPGSGHELFARQVLYLGASRGDVKAIYVNTDRPVEDIVEEMEVFGFTLPPLIEDGRWSFVDVYTHRLNVQKGVAGPKVLQDVLAELPGMVKPDVWIAVDTLSFFLQRLEITELLNFIDELLGRAREGGGLYFLLLVGGLHEERELRRLAHLVDGVFTFSLDPTQADPIGSLRIQKLRRAEYVTRNISYRITDRGITIETTVRLV